MPDQSLAFLNNLAVREALKQAWQDSNPGVSGGHEEGGFVLQASSGILSVARWPGGAQSSIFVPPHPNCKFGDGDIIATFHTHPNTGDDYLQEPSETDKRAVRDDPDLKDNFYEGEIVISQQTIYLIAPSGQVREIGSSQQILAEA